MTYTLRELLAMDTIKDEEEQNHPYGDLKVDTDKERVWFNPETNEVIIEQFNYGMGTGWEVEQEYIAE